MIIDRFGAVYASAYAFGRVAAEQETAISRPAVLQQVGGMAGAFDVWRDDGSPWAPVVLPLKFKLTAASYAAVDTALAALKAATVDAGRSKLWRLGRDGTTVQWAWAKCTELAAKEAPGVFLTLPVDLKFILPEGAWYGATINTATRTGSGTLSCTNNGDVRALVKAVVPAGAVNPSLAIGAGPPIWLWTGTTAGAGGLVVDAAAYSVVNNGADAWATLSYGVGGVGQIEFFWLPPGTSTVTFAQTGTPVDVVLTWWDTYL